MASSFKPSVTLKHFRCSSSLLASQFDPQSQFPSFFRNNLLDPLRIIFKFTDCPINNGIRVFYFQLFKICFQLTLEDLQQPRDYLKEFTSIILDDRFRIKCSQKESVDTQNLNNSMFKPLLREFFQILERQTTKRFEEVIIQHPVLDNILLNIFRTFLWDFGVLKRFESQMPVGSVLEALAEMFDLKITKINKCYRFDEADVFCYVQNDKQLYVASKGSQPKSAVVEPSETMRRLIENKENISSNCNITPPKEEKKLAQISTSGVIEQEPSELYSSSQKSSIFAIKSIQEFQSTNQKPIDEGPIQQDDAVNQSSNLVKQHLAHLLQTPEYQPLNYQDDFTSTLVLEIIHKPYRENIRAVKERAKQRKGIMPLMI